MSSSGSSPGTADAAGKGAMTMPVARPRRRHGQAGGARAKDGGSGWGPVPWGRDGRRGRTPLARDSSRGQDSHDDVNAAVALVVTVVMMLVGTAIAIFTGVVDPLPASKVAAQEFQLRELAMSVFVVGAAFVAWRTTMHGIK